MTPAQVAAELAAALDTADAFTPYSLTTRTAAPISPAHKEIQP